MKFDNLARHEELAGKIVYANGLNSVYNDLGYHQYSINPHNPNYAGTTMSICGQPVKDALAGKEWARPSVVGLVDWNHGQPDMEHPIKDDADFDWGGWMILG